MYTRRANWILAALGLLLLLLLCGALAYGAYTLWPKGPNPTPQPPAATPPSGGSTPAPAAQKVTFEATVNGQHDNAYDVVYDPDQSGAADLPAKGWWYQPNLPGPHKQAHEVALTLQAGTYRYVGPECVVYHNWDGTHPFDQGKVLINRQNVEDLVVPATSGHGNEAWVFVRCGASDASGFSFALK